jgi:hypothetical protein
MAWERGGGEEGGWGGEELVLVWGVGRATTQGNKGQSDDNNLTWATAPLQKGQQWATRQLQLNLGNGATAMGTTTPAKGGGYRLGSFSLA